MDGSTQRQSARTWVSKGFGWVEDVVYVGLGVLLAGCALTLLASGALTFWQQLLAHALSEHIVQLLDRLLLILLIIEVMYTRKGVVMSSESLDDEKLLTKGEVAQLCRVDVRTVDRWRVAGKVGWQRTPSGRVLFKKHDVLTAIDRRRDP